MVHAHYQAGDPHLGEPLCPDCYDYVGQVLFNWSAPELWRRFTIALYRNLPDGLKVSYAKVAELQARGAVHFHAVIRLDDRGGDYQPPRLDISSDQLADAVRQAAAHVRLTVDTGNDAVTLRFGHQLDIKTIHPTGKPGQPGHTPDGKLTQATVAAYISKYGTKAADDFGLGGKPLDPATARELNLSAHVVRIIETCHQLAAARPELEGLRRWTHMLGYRGHFSTRSRRYSVTLGSIHRERTNLLPAR